MYTVVIVDDEYFIRQYYSRMIDWDTLGFSVSNIFKSAKEALEYMQTNKVDCVLTDIKMTSINGIELLKICKEKYPDTKVVLISGYSDFEFAKDAIKYGAEDYLLKPIETQELAECMEKIKNNLDQKQFDHFILQQYKREFLNAVLHGHYRNENNTNQLLINHKISIPENSKIAIIEIKTEENDLEKTISLYTSETFSTIIQNMIETSDLPVNGYFISAIKNTICYILFSLSETEDFNALSDKHSNILISVLNDFAQIVCLAKTQTFYDSFHELCTAKRRIQLEKSDITDTNKLFEINTSLSEHKELLLTYIHSGNISEIEVQLFEFFEELKDNDIETIISLSLYLIKIIIEAPFFSDTSIDRTKIQKYVSDIKNASDTKIIHSIILAAIKDIMNYVGTDKRNNFSHNSVILAKKYIEEHFCEDISLEKLASMYYLSPSHFSKTFRSVFGINYAEFLKKCRMEKAKSLLENTDYKIYHVGKMVGYENTKFFARNFKQTYGLTPKGYRERKQGVSESDGF